MELIITNLEQREELLEMVVLLGTNNVEHLKSHENFQAINSEVYRYPTNLVEVVLLMSLSGCGNISGNVKSSTVSLLDEGNTGLVSLEVDNLKG